MTNVIDGVDLVARGVIRALKSDEGQEVLLEAMADKLEKTAGWCCKDPKERVEIRKDMEFVRDFRQTTRSGIQRIIGFILAICAGGLLSYLGVKSQFLK